MKCQHCCFDCTSKGQDMTRANFDAALSLVNEDNGISNLVTIGGGEPTLHKLCMDFVWQAIRQTMESSYSVGMSIVGLVTNGSVESKAVELARLAEQGLLSARLSYDTYHDTSMVSDRVKHAFGVGDKRDAFSRRNSERERDLRVVNEWRYLITPHGRALENEIYNHPYSKVGDCCCKGLFVTPDGTIWQCGCRKVVLGHVTQLEAFRDKYYGMTKDDDNGDGVGCSQKVS